MVNERRAERWARRATIGRTGGRFGFRARRAWRRLRTAAVSGDQVALSVLLRMSEGPASRRQRDARTALAYVWATTRDPALRAVVVRTGALADGSAILITAALHNRLLEYLSPADAADATTLLADPDEEVRAGAVNALREATGDLLAALWRVAGDGTPRIRAGAGSWWAEPLPLALLANPCAPPPTSVDMLWRTWLVTPHEVLWRALSRWRMIGSAEDLRMLSCIAVGPAPLRLDRPGMRLALVDAAGRGGHPIAAIAQARILAAGDARLVDEVCDAALTQPVLAAFCRASRLDPVDPLRRAMFHLLTDETERARGLSALVRTSVVTAMHTPGDLLASLWRIAGDEPRDESRPWWTAPLSATLLAHLAPPAAPILDALWTEWLVNPDPVVWKALSTWQVPGSSDDVRGMSLVAIEPDARRLAGDDLRPALLDAAAWGDHPIAAIAQNKIIAASDQDLVDAVCEAALTKPELASFCRARKLAPRDPVRRSMFFVLTGQPEQIQALDPDGALLSLAYNSADEATRGRLQQAMLSRGELDLVRILIGEERRGRIQTMSEAEVRYLAEQLADRGAWSDLWRIVLDLPLLRATSLMALFGDDWRPGDADSRVLFHRLSTVDATVLKRGMKQMRRFWPLAIQQARIAFQGRVNDVSFAPDAPLLAVAGTARVAGVVDLTRGRLVERYEGFGASVGRVLHVGGGMFLAGERTNTTTGECRVLRCANRRLGVAARVRGTVTSLTAVGADRFAAGTRAGDVLLGPVLGEAPTRVPVSRLDLDPEYDWPRTVAADPGGERLAVLGRSLVLADSRASRVLAQGYQQTVAARALLLGPDLLATSDQNGKVNVLRRANSSFRLTAQMSVPGLGGLAAVGSRKQIVVANRAGDLHFHDEATLAGLGRVAGRGLGPATSLHVAARGDFLAVGYAAGYTDVYDLRVGDVPSLVMRPMIDMVPAHLGVLTAARKSLTAADATCVVLDLLRACLEHRFRFDIEISDTVTLAVGEYDIALA